MAGERSKSDPTQGRAKLNPGYQAKPGTPGTGENLCPDCGGSGRIGRKHAIGSRNTISLFSRDRGSHLIEPSVDHLGIDLRP